MILGQLVTCEACRDGSCDACTRYKARQYADSRRCVTFVRPHVQVHPATVLEGIEPRTRVKYVISTIEETRDTYVPGQEVRFGSVSAAKAFVKAINGDTRPIVCVHGRI